MVSYKEDYQYGMIKELEVLDIIKKYFDRDINKSIDRYCNYDFYDDKFTYELKSRRNKYDTYPTTMIPELKLKKRTILLFNFLDGLYYIKYKKNKFEEFERGYFCKDRNDKKDVNKGYVYIPIDKLKCIIKY